MGEKMREIKFRIWIESEKIFITPLEVEDYSIGDLITNPDYQLEQFTGLKDSKGRDIYEGDLVKEPEGTEPVIYVHGSYEPISYYKCEFLTVVGNIHEPLPESPADWVARHEADK